MESPAFVAYVCHTNMQSPACVAYDVQTCQQLEN